ncbi:DegT/DnrJ/EryC1/StrS family aminotransferase [Desulfovibrio sp. OttesenSCG-928-C14]|nr:DegT/DnrJ/EryC1/StrS family aminotransferase [Desulfovibrio sp. OttesenSCG-928-C14]
MFRPDNTLHIPQADPSKLFIRFLPQIIEAIQGVIHSKQYILGRAVEDFESALAAYLGSGPCVGVGSGTDAVYLALRAVGVKRGDEVITTSLTAAGTGQAILLCGAIPRFADVDYRTRCLSAGAVEAAITPRTVAIVPVHLYGQPANMPDLLKIANNYGLAVVEDCAQALGAHIHGRKVGTFGQAAAFSFYPTKNLGALGDGGAVACNVPALANRVRALRSYGWKNGVRESCLVAGNSRLDAVQASVLSVLLPYLDENNQKRASLARRYINSLSLPGLDLPEYVDGATYHQFVVACSKREELRLFLAECGIGAELHYSPPLHKQPVFAQYGNDALPVTEKLSERVLSLPIQPEVTERHLDYITAAVTEWARSLQK